MLGLVFAPDGFHSGEDHAQGGSGCAVASIGCYLKAGSHGLHTCDKSQATATYADIRSPRLGCSGVPSKAVHIGFCCSLLHFCEGHVMQE